MNTLHLLSTRSRALLELIPAKFDLGTHCRHEINKEEWIGADYQEVPALGLGG